MYLSVFACVSCSVQFGNNNLRSEFPLKVCILPITQNRKLINYHHTNKSLVVNDQTMVLIPNDTSCLILYLFKGCLHLSIPVLNYRMCSEFETNKSKCPRAYLTQFIY